jgi:hypothetical protein
MPTKLAFVILMISCSTALSQELGSPDTKWLYDLRQKNGVTKVEYESDTIIDNIFFRKFALELTAINIDMDTVRGNADPIYIANESGLVLYQWRDENIDTLFNFNADLGDEWTYHDGSDQYVLTVVDTFMTEINSKSLFSVAYSIKPLGTQFSFADTIFEGLGSKYSFLIPFDGYNVGTHSNYGGTLRCFENDELGFVDLNNSELDGFSLYSDFEYDCSNLTSVIDLSQPSENITLFPNPVIQHINFLSPQNDIVIYNLRGEVILELDMNRKTQLDVGILENGIYFVSTRDSVTKFLKL